MFLYSFVNLPSKYIPTSDDNVRNFSYVIKVDMFLTTKFFVQIYFKYKTNKAHTSTPIQENWQWKTCSPIKSFLRATCFLLKISVQMKLFHTQLFDKKSPTIFWSMHFYRAEILGRGGILCFLLLPQFSFNCLWTHNKFLPRLGYQRNNSFILAHSEVWRKKKS